MSRLNELLEHLRGESFFEDWTDYRGREHPGEDPRKKQKRYKNMREYTRAMNAVLSDAWAWGKASPGSEAERSAAIELEKSGVLKRIDRGKYGLTDKGRKVLASGGNK